MIIRDCCAIVMWAWNRETIYLQFPSVENVENITLTNTKEKKNGVNIIHSPYVTV